MICIFVDGVLKYPLSFIMVQETQVQCNPNENKTQADCQLGNPFKRDSEVWRVVQILLRPPSTFSINLIQVHFFSTLPGFILPDT